MASYQNSFNRGQVVNNMSRPMNIGSLGPGVSAAYRPRVRSPMGVPPRPVPILHGLPVVRSGVMIRQNAPVVNSSNFPMVRCSIHITTFEVKLL